MNWNDKLAGVPEQALGQLKDSMKGEGGVFLPFPVIYIYSVRGRPDMDPSQGIRHFGGWGTDAEEALSVMEQLKIDSLPKGFALEDRRNASGGTFGAYETRTVIVAPIGFRMRWMDGDRNWGTHFDADKGFTRRHIQVLSAMGQANNSNGAISYVMPVVLTAKGWAAQYLQKALDATREALYPILRETGAPDLPPCAFWTCVGTFGEEAKFIKVGKGNNTNQITSIDSITLPQITTDTVDHLFVGGENLSRFSDLLHDAKDWLGAWSLEAEAEVAADPNAAEGLYPEPLMASGQDEHAQAPGSLWGA